ncbi:hypothetical protein [Schaalia sp. ZJ1691]|uniref:hypothetical protein n=1 Tax=Schaalia sp. ZJ1691 TaxID=2709404 RepID=UPI0013ED248F|nr:hypothetical protein [Schaalia sp. ZJ1691]
MTPDDDESVGGAVTVRERLDHRVTVSSLPSTSIRGGDACDVTDAGVVDSEESVDA